MRGLVVVVSLVASGCPRPLPDIDTETTSSGANDTMESTTAAVGSSTTGAEPSTPVLTLGFSQVKQLDFSWAAVQGADHYELLERLAPGEDFTLLAGDLVGESVSFEMPLHLRWEASYRLRACNDVACTESDPVDVMGSLVEAVGYVKASNTDQGDSFGFDVALSGDGNTLAIGAISEDSSSVGLDGDQHEDVAPDAGAVYVFVREGMGAWSQQAYVKASNTGVFDLFGQSVALSGDGHTLAVGAPGESSSATGIDGDPLDDSAYSSGAVHVFMRNDVGEWSQQAYVKASNTNTEAYFGQSVALSGDGNTLAVGAPYEDSGASNIDGDQTDTSAPDSGAVYVFDRDPIGAWAWTQQVYIKASNTDAEDHFGWSVALSRDGDTLVVGADGEDSNATGIGGDQANHNEDSGAAYVFVRSVMDQWSQQAYVKASNTDDDDAFGSSVTLSADGNTFAVGAYLESSDASGVGGDETNDSASASGAVYVFARDGMGAWFQQAYVKASNTGVGDLFGWDIALSADGNSLAVGAPDEDSDAIGLGGNQTTDTASEAGAVYLFVRDDMGAWSPETYVKASTVNSLGFLGVGVALSGDGNTLAGGAPGEPSDATGIAGDQANDDALSSGAVYLY